MSARLKYSSYYLPEIIVTNEMIHERFPSWPPSRLKDLMGVENRYYASEGETVNDIAVKAAEKLFLEFPIDRSEIDFVLLCTQTPDYFSPTNACIIQDRLGIRKNSGALDFSHGCSGFIYGLGLAKSLIMSGIAANVLLITADTISRALDPDDQATVLFFGDGASASLITKSDEDHFYPFIYGTDGGGADHLTIKGGAFADKSVESNTSKPCLHMNGTEIYTFSINTVPGLVKDTLAKANMTMDEIDLVVFHQANKYMLESLRKLIKIPPEKYAIYTYNGGNTTSSTIPIALRCAIDEGRVTSGSKILVAGFGVGLSWASSIFKL
jgi:3-oxoacyl-[acyl-carrier-protein] synthase-3